VTWRATSMDGRRNNGPSGSDIARYNRRVSVNRYPASASVALAAYPVAGRRQIALAVVLE